MSDYPGIFSHFPHVLDSITIRFIVAMDRRVTSRPRFEEYLSHSAWKGMGTTMGIAAVVKLAFLL